MLTKKRRLYKRDGVLVTDITYYHRIRITDPFFLILLFK